MCLGGLTLTSLFTAARLRELCKMDGAVIIDPDSCICSCPTLPDPTIPTDESGMRHRTAQRTARQTHLPVLSLSASMRMISIYVAPEHGPPEPGSPGLSRANLPWTPWTATVSDLTSFADLTIPNVGQRATSCATSPLSCSAWK